MENYETEMNLKATELRLGLPGRDELENAVVRCNKRSSPEASEGDSNVNSNGSSDITSDDKDSAPPAK